MNAVPFDTLKFARAPRDKAKLSPEQAEGFADAIAEAIQGDLATKRDIAESNTAVTTDIRDVKTAMQAESQGMKTSLQTEIQSVKTSLQAEIQGVKVSLQTEIQSARSDLRETKLRLEAKIEASKAEIVKWMFGTIGFQTLIILGAVIAMTRVVRP